MMTETVIYLNEVLNLYNSPYVLTMSPYDGLLVRRTGVNDATD